MYKVDDEYYTAVVVKSGSNQTISNNLKDGKGQKY